MAERIVGLDIGTSALRAVELIADGDRPPGLEAFGQVGLPHGVIVDGEVRDRGQVAAALRRLWRDGGFKSTRVRLGVAGLRAITREIELPPLPPEEVSAAVALQAEDIVPFPLEQTSLASAVISRTQNAEGLPLIRVLVAAAHRELIDGVVGAVEEAGLEPEAIDLDTAALSRAFALPGSPGGTEAVVSVGAGLTMVVVHNGGTLQFVRTIVGGGGEVTGAIASALDLPIADAEVLKRRLELDGRHDPAAVAVTAKAVERLCEEIRSSIRYYTAMPGRSAPERVLLTGGGARTVGLIDALRARSDAPVLEASPLSSVDADRIDVTAAEAQAINQTLAVPLGLALDVPGGTRFELMPAEVRRRRTERRRRRLLNVAAVTVLVALVALSAWRVLAERSVERRVAALQGTVQTINTVDLPRYDKAVRLGQEVTDLQHQLAPLVAHEVDWLVVLNQLGEYLPPSAVLNGVDLTSADPTGGGPPSPLPAASGSGGRSTVIGTGTSTVYTRTLTEVTLFGLTMAKSPALTGVDLSGSVASSATAVSFPVSFSIAPAAHGQREGLFKKAIP